MDPIESDPLSEYINLKSKDENEFYHLVVNYFFERAAEYRGKYTVIFFSGDDGVFEITGKICFEDHKKLKDFHNKVGRRDYHLILGPYKEGFKFIFNGKFQFGVEVFEKSRKVIYLNFDQTLKDVIEGRKELPPPGAAFRDMIIGKALEQHAVAVAAKKRKLAS